MKDAGIQPRVSFFRGIYGFFLSRGAFSMYAMGKLAATSADGL